MVFSPDGDWLYFISNRPLPGYSLSALINGPGQELYPMLVADGSLCFSAAREDSMGERDSYRAAYVDGAFTEPRTFRSLRPVK